MGQICICLKMDNTIRQRNHGFQPKYRFGFPIIKNRIRQKNDGLEPKYRFGFLHISIKEMRRKIMGLAEVQIWISLNVYRGIRKKNDGFQPKYRFGFSIIKNGIRQKNDGLESKYRFGFA